MSNAKRYHARSGGAALAEHAEVASEPTRQYSLTARPRVNYEDLREEMHSIVNNAGQVRKLPGIFELLKYVKDIVQGKHLHKNRP